MMVPQQMDNRGASDMPLGGVQAKVEVLRMQGPREMVQKKTKLVHGVGKEAKMVILGGGTQVFALSLPSTLRLRCYYKGIPFMEPRGEYKEGKPLGQKCLGKKKFYCQ